MIMTVDEIFADDRRNPPMERSLPWEETRGGVTVFVEPKPHWAEDMRRYADWSAHGARTRFYGHIDTSGDDVMMEARAIIAREIADGLWD